jgi:hypothetical protein
MHLNGSLSKRAFFTYFAGALLAAACADAPSREEPHENGAGCEGGCSAETTPGDDSAEAQRSQGPTTCVAPNGTACVYTPWSECQSPEDCKWNCTGLPQLCDDVTIHGDGSIEGDPTCLLEALRDGAEGMLRWHVAPTFQSSYNQTMFIIGGRRALRHVVEFNDISGTVDRDGPAPLRDAAFFANCLAQSGPAALKACLTEAAVGCGLSKPD